MRLSICILAVLFWFFTDSFANAVILWSTDEGESWIKEESGCLFDLNDVGIDFAGGIAVAVGDNGSILRRGTDGIWEDVGIEWLNADLYSVSMGVSGTCMACGEDGTLLSSFDRGETWKIVADFNCGGIDLFSVHFEPTGAAYFAIAGENGFLFLASSDASVSTGIESDFIASCGYMCRGFPELVLTRDGSCYSVETGEVASLGEVVLRGAGEIISGGSNFIACGEKGVILRHQEGMQWVEVESGVLQDLSDVACVSWGSSACAVGDNGLVLLSRDNGYTWESADSGTTRDLLGISSNGSGLACIVGRSALSGRLIRNR